MLLAPVRGVRRFRGAHVAHDAFRVLLELDGQVEIIEPPSCFEWTVLPRYISTPNSPMAHWDDFEIAEFAVSPWFAVPP